MVIKKIVFLIGVLFFIACSEDNNEVIKPINLAEYISVHNNKELDEVIACAASENGKDDVSYIFYYPIETATNIQYFETENALVDKEDFELYVPLELEKEDVFNGYLERFIRNSTTESWCIVTYETAGKVHVSNPIRLKNATQPTEWINTVVIDTETSLMPRFTWEDSIIGDNAIYFQVVTSSENDFISGTYTFNTWFQFYKLDNVVLNITNEISPVLTVSQEYNLTVMGISEDNWVNFVIQKPFISE